MTREDESELSQARERTWLNRYDQKPEDYGSFCRGFDAGWCVRARFTTSEEPLTRSELIKACADAGFDDRHWRVMTYLSGPYDITEPRAELIRLVEILTKRKYDRDS